MATMEELMAGGMSARLARALGQSAQTTVTSAGTTQTDATQIPVGAASVILPTASANTGVILPTASGHGIISIYNNSGQTIKIYGFASEQINVIAAASAFSLTSAKSAICIPHGNGWFLTMSA